MIGTTCGTTFVIFGAGSIRFRRTISVAGGDHWDEPNTMVDPVARLRACMVSRPDGPFRYMRNGPGKWDGSRDEMLCRRVRNSCAAAMQAYPAGLCCQGCAPGGICGLPAEEVAHRGNLGAFYPVAAPR